MKVLTWRVKNPHVGCHLTRVIKQEMWNRSRSSCVSPSILVLHWSHFAWVHERLSGDLGCLLGFLLCLSVATSVSKRRGFCKSGAVFSVDVGFSVFPLWAEMLPPTPLTLIQPHHAHNLPAWFKVMRSQLLYQKTSDNFITVTLI